MRVPGRPILRWHAAISAWRGLCCPFPIAPPPEVVRGFDPSRKAEIARLLTAPKVMHKIRLFNKSDAPLTTAPALIVSNDRVIAQGMMNYTAVGAAFDLELTAAGADAVSIPVIASGGVGTLEHLYEGFVKGRADAVLAAEENVQTKSLAVTVPAKEKAVITLEAMTKAANVQVAVKGM